MLHSLLTNHMICIYCSQKLNRVKAVEKEKDNLEGPKNEAVQFLNMENDIVRQKNKLYHKYM